MKKIVSLLLVLMLVLSLGVGCTTDQPADEPDQEQNQDADQEQDQDADQEPAKAEFSITVNGTEFTNENAKDLEFVTVTINKKDKDDNLKPGQWQGYRIKDILEAAGVEEYTSVKVAAADEFSVDLTKDVVDAETTLLGFIKDGEALSEDESPRLTVEGEGSSVWIKGVASIETK